MAPGTFLGSLEKRRNYHVKNVSGCTCSLSAGARANECPLFDVIDPQPADDPQTIIEIPPGLQPLEDVLQLIGITDLLGPPLTSSSSQPGGGGGDGGSGGGGGSGGEPQLHTAAFIVPMDFGQIDFGLEWRIQRFGTYLEATVLVTINPVDGVTLHQEYAGAFTLRRHGDYEARYTGTIFTLDAPEPITLEVSGRLMSGVTENEAPGVVLETTLPETGPMLIPAQVTLFDFVLEPDEGSPRAAGGPGFQYCGGGCGCPAPPPGGAIAQNRCITQTRMDFCINETCIHNPNNIETPCVWIPGCSMGVPAGMVGTLLGLVGFGLRRQQSRSRRVQDGRGATKRIYFASY